MLNAVKYNHTVAFVRNWPALSVLNFKKWQKMAVFGYFKQLWLAYRLYLTQMNNG